MTARVDMPMTRSTLAAAAAVAGVLLGAAFTRATQHSVTHTIVGAPTPIRATLYRFETNGGASGAFADWMRWHRANHAPIVETLECEDMYVEAMFRDTVARPDVIYWLAVDGEGALPSTPRPWTSTGSTTRSYARCCAAGRAGC